jgi:hypothetical protein
MIPTPHPVQPLDYQANAPLDLDPAWVGVVKMTMKAGVVLSLLIVFTIGPDFPNFHYGLLRYGAGGQAVGWLWFVFALLLLVGSLGAHGLRRAFYGLFLVSVAGCAITALIALGWTIVQQWRNFASPFFALWLVRTIAEYAISSLFPAFLFWLMLRPAARRCFKHPPVPPAPTFPRA